MARCNLHLVSETGEALPLMLSLLGQSTLDCPATSKLGHIPFNISEEELTRLLGNKTSSVMLVSRGSSVPAQNIEKKFHHGKKEDACLQTLARNFSPVCLP